MNSLNTKVNLPLGGYLFIQQTEALTVVDVNSGKFISSATQDETILKTNLEAVHEIARQLRLRNIGGMIIIDFIDMMNRNDKLAIMEEMELALEKDKAKPQVGQLSDLGLVELTRHRQGQSLAEIFSKKCPHCQGTGYIADDLTFSAPVAEGEFRAKASKLKTSVQQVKNKSNNKFNKPLFNNQENNETQSEEIQPQTEVQEEQPQNENRNNNQNNQNKKNKFNKNRFNKNRRNNETPIDTQEQHEEIKQEVKEEPKIEEPVKTIDEPKAVEESKETEEKTETKKKTTKSKATGAKRGRKPKKAAEEVKADE